MLNAVVTWVGAVLVTAITVFLVAVCYKWKRTRSDMEQVLLPEDSSSVTGETFAVEVELPNYDSLTNASTHASGEKISTEPSVCATAEGSHPSELDTVIRQSYLVCVQNTNGLAQELNCQAASVTRDQEINGSAEGAPNQRQYLVRVSHINDDIGPPPLYEGDNQDNSPPPVYEDDNQDNSPPPVYEGDNQDNSPPPLYEGDNQDNSQYPLYEGDNQDNSPPPLCEGDNQDNSPPPLCEGDNQDDSPLPLYEGDNQDNRLTG